MKGVEQQTFAGHSSYVFPAIQLSYEQLVSVSVDKTIKLWDLKRKTCVATLTGHCGVVFSVKVLSDVQLVSGSNESVVIKALYFS